MSSAAVKLDAKVADQLYNADEAAKILGVSRSTFYTLVWFKARKLRVSPGTVRYLASDISLYQSLCRDR